MDVLRIALLREQWQCLAEDDSPACVADVSQVLPELSAAPRPAPAKMAGPWKVFDVTAVPFPDDAAVGVPAVLLIKDMPDTSPCLLDDIRHVIASMITATMRRRRSQDSAHVLQQ